ncbi:hypothetical protein MRO55_24960, partial [Escherichia coli]|uniref:hypothetical protein n=1 Tax=Escherichia coli TaxID=562 RepID=UPI002113CD21
CAGHFFVIGKADRSLMGWLMGFSGFAMVYRSAEGCRGGWCGRLSLRDAQNIDAIAVRHSAAVIGSPCRFLFTF